MQQFRLCLRKARGVTSSHPAAGCSTSARSGWRSQRTGPRSRGKAMPSPSGPSSRKSSTGTPRRPPNSFRCAARWYRRSPSLHGAMCGVKARKLQRLRRPISAGAMERDVVEHMEKRRAAREETRRQERAKVGLGSLAPARAQTPSRPSPRLPPTP